MKVLCWPFIDSRIHFIFLLPDQVLAITTFDNLGANYWFSQAIFDISYKSNCFQMKFSLHKKWTFPLRIFSVNVNKFTGNWCFQLDGPFRGYSRIGGSKRHPAPKICHTYPRIMKLSTIVPCIKKIQKIYRSRDTPHELYWHQDFFNRN